MYLERLGQVPTTIVTAAAIFASTGSAQKCGKDIPVPRRPPCECYFDTDCSVGECVTTGYLEGSGSGGCALSGKNDGLCQPGAIIDQPPDGGDGGGGLGLGQMTGAIDVALEAYLVPIREGGGQVSGRAWRQVDDVAGSPKVARAARSQALQLMDLVFGWDVGLTDPQVEGAPPNVRFIEDPATGEILLAALRQGVADFGASGDPDAVWTPIQEFHDAHPGFHPAHLGRCYPHGHEGVPTLEDCQRDGLVRRMEAVLEVTVLE